MRLILALLISGLVAFAGCLAPLHDTVEEGAFIFPPRSEIPPPHPIRYNGSVETVAWDGGLATVHGVALESIVGDPWILKGILSVRTSEGDRLLVREAKVTQFTVPPSAQVLWFNGAGGINGSIVTLGGLGPPAFDLGGEVRLEGVIESPEYSGHGEIRAELASITANTPIAFAFVDARIEPDVNSGRMLGASALHVEITGGSASNLTVRETTVNAKNFRLDLVSGGLDASLSSFSIEGSAVQIAYDSKPRFGCRFQVQDVTPIGEREPHSFEVSFQLQGPGSAEHTRVEVTKTNAARIDVGIIRLAGTNDTSAAIVVEGVSGQTLAPGEAYVVRVTVEGENRPGDFVILRAQNCPDANVSLSS